MVAESRGKPVIRISHLSKTYGRTTVLNDIDLELPRGSSTALWGPNGAGKTTIVLCILGFLRHQGSIEVSGYDTRRSGKSVRSLIGYVPQQPGFFDDLTVAETLDLSASLRRRTRAETLAAAERVGIASQYGKAVGALSGGMRQRLALAVALLSDPPVLLLDEPTANLDAASRESTVRLLEDLRGDDRTIVVTSHHLEEVSMLVERVVIMDQGRIVDQCAPGELSERLGIRSYLHLVLDPPDIARAAQLLAAAGMAARANGHGILIDVAPSAKGRAVAALVNGGVDIHDLEVWR